MANDSLKSLPKYNLHKKRIVLFVLLTLSGCSLVQWLPSSSCERVTYDRVGNKVTVLAECTL
jgi:hypothetical protein